MYLFHFTDNSLNNILSVVTLSNTSASIIIKPLQKLKQQNFLLFQHSSIHRITTRNNKNNNNKKWNTIYNIYSIIPSTNHTHHKITYKNPKPVQVFNIVFIFSLFTFFSSLL